MKTRLNVRPSSRRPLLRATLASLCLATLGALAGPAAIAAEPAATAPRLDAVQGAAAAVTPPDAATVLYYIYQIDGKGADS
ncbi:hypothetical protein LZB40_10115, partial [Campylobacter jejuni]|nr:hypothetical protein [Campylobacter jejuni]